MYLSRNWCKENLNLSIQRCNKKQHWYGGIYHLVNKLKIKSKKQERYANIKLQLNFNLILELNMSRVLKEVISLPVQYFLYVIEIVFDEPLV